MGWDRGGGWVLAFSSCTRLYRGPEGESKRLSEGVSEPPSTSLQSSPRGWSSPPAPNPPPPPQPTLLAPTNVCEGAGWRRERGRFHRIRLSPCVLFLMVTYVYVADSPLFYFQDRRAYCYRPSRLLLAFSR